VIATSEIVTGSARKVPNAVSCRAAASVIETRIAVAGNNIGCPLSGPARAPPQASLFV